MRRLVLLLVALFVLAKLGQSQSIGSANFNLPREEKNKIEAISRISRRSVDTSMTAGISWNNVVELIFSIAKNDIIGQGVDVISLPNVRKDFNRKVGFLTVKGIFTAEHGKLSNISTLERSEDVSVVKEDSKWKMVCVFSLKELKVRYDNYKMDVGGLHLKGVIEGAASSNSIRMTLLFVNSPTGCVTTLDEVKVVTMEGLQVNVTGLGPFNFLGSGIAKWAVEQKRGDIVKTIELILAREAKKALTVFQCDEYASLLML